MLWLKQLSYAARGNQAGLKQALTAGLEAGVTVNEFKEILVQVYAYCGFPRSLNALNTLMQLEEERGNGDEQGRLPSAKPEGNSLDYGTENQTKLVGQPVRGKIYEFAPAIDEFLKAHLFGDVFARDNVDWQTRELATIAMLASMDNVTDQLNGHVNIGRHNRNGFVRVGRRKCRLCRIFYRQKLFAAADKRGYQRFKRYF